MTAIIPRRKNPAQSRFWVSFSTKTKRRAQFLGLSVMFDSFLSLEISPNKIRFDAKLLLDGCNLVVGR
jgi:hypothetical protein